MKGDRFDDILRRLDEMPTQAAQGLRRFIEQATIHFGPGRVYGRNNPLILSPVDVAEGCALTLMVGEEARVKSFSVAQPGLDVRLMLGKYYALVVRDDVVRCRLRFYLFEEHRSQGKPTFELAVARALDFPEGTYASSQDQAWIDLVGLEGDEELTVLLNSFITDELWRLKHGLPITVSEQVLREWFV